MKALLANFSHLLLLFFSVWALLSYDRSQGENYLVSLIAIVPLIFLIATDSISRPSVWVTTIFEYFTCMLIYEGTRLSGRNLF